MIKKIIDKGINFAGDRFHFVMFIAIMSMVLTAITLTALTFLHEFNIV